MINKSISNIYVSGNVYLKDWDVIKIAKLDNYPKTLINSTSLIINRLEKNDMITKARVSKKKLTIVNIEIEENRPLFYDDIKKKTVLLDGKIIDEKYDVPILNSTFKNELYEELKNKMKKISTSVLHKMSEITYSPDQVDDERFLITMTDGNYVYVTLDKITLINDYNSIVKEFNNKKGVLFLNSGGYFKIMEN